MKNIARKPNVPNALRLCKYNAIDLNMKAQSLSLKVGSIVWATGWNPYDAERLIILDSGIDSKRHNKYDDGEACLSKWPY